MSGADFEQVRRILVELRPLDGQARAAQLDRLCAGDAALRREVESLLGHAESAEEWLDTPAIDRLSPTRVAEALVENEAASMPTAIGPYRVLGVLGRGGMGVVYRAQQEHPRREVALKVLRGHVPTPHLLRRFRREAEILGKLQHSGIAHVYDAGVWKADSGEAPYLAMELVAGERLLEYAADRQPDTRARLELVARICDAVEYAHRIGVVHRDLKPDNILVQADGAPKILDFGVARATDRDLDVTTLQTMAGQVIGTLPYMSPEQVAGDPTAIDHRTDVYALGVVLFELLSGRLPIEVSRRTIAEAARIIQDDDPARLGSIDTHYRGDVDTIVAKAMAKEVDRRYQSAADFAADIRRFLGDRPIVARPSSSFYYIAKFAARHRGVVAALAALIVTLAVGVVLSLDFAFGEAEQRRLSTLR